ncbi:hypothetical protein L2E82_28940 [Cichorium intybus]|uniref:Uncharacterized protein n=1 Tax=Cichorium intybus TaxID=13427 RepID=A0ACB9CWV7_CICIN|nr:hypothetical protein L2E82_28940 [Cichorium intybus]
MASTEGDGVKRVFLGDEVYNILGTDYVIPKHNQSSYGTKSLDWIRDRLNDKNSLHILNWGDLGDLMLFLA